MRTRGLALIGLVTVLLCPAMSGGGTFAADAAACQAYAAQAVAQLKENQSIDGCFKGADRRWHADYDVHYGWCLTAPPQALAAETSYRAARLRDCRDRALGAQ